MTHNDDGIPPCLSELFGNLPRFEAPHFAAPDFEVVPSTTAEHAEEQIEQNRDLLALIGAMKQIEESQAADAKANAVQEAVQQKYNQRMTWVAIILAAGAVVVPFIERVL